MEVWRYAYDSFYYKSIKVKINKYTLIASLDTASCQVHQRSFRIINSMYLVMLLVQLGPLRPFDQGFVLWFLAGRMNVILFIIIFIQ